VVVDLVLNLQLGAVVLIQPEGRLHVGRGRVLILSSSPEADGQAIEALGALCGVIGSLVGVGDVCTVLVHADDADEVILDVSADSTTVVLFLGRPGGLSPEALEVLGVVLEVEAKMMLILMSEVPAGLELDLGLLVVLEVFL